jgi:hypothetical protein
MDASNDGISLANRALESFRSRERRRIRVRQLISFQGRHRAYH